jgi:hypothetical protein
MAAERFEGLATTLRFWRMGADALGCVVDDDRLAASKEEAVWEAGLMEGWARRWPRGRRPGGRRAVCYGSDGGGGV